MRTTGRSLPEAEASRLGTTHDHLGAYLLGLWGFPTAVVECIAQRQSSAVPGAGDLLDVLRLASGLASEHVPLAFEDADAVRARAEAAAARLDLNGIEEWRAIARDMVPEIDIAA
jgi:HD-like signal output (HDOD) protein